MDTALSAIQIIWVLATYLIASVPFSVLIGKVVLGVDIRQFGDGNPGATNVKRAGGGMGLFIFAICMDGAKGLFPVGIAYWIVGWDGLAIVLIAYAAILGHAFSVWLGFKGGKAIATTVGVWIGLTILEAPIVMMTLLTYWFLSVDSSDWAVILWWLSYMAYLLLTHAQNSPFIVIWLGMGLVLLYKHRHGLSRFPAIRRWLPFLPRQTESG
jgi:glycerol-3-phosphate acyltransferase PlsY